MQAAALLTLYSAREQRAQAAAEEARALAPKVGAARSGDAPTPCSRATPATPCPPPAAGPFRPPRPRPRSRQPPHPPRSWATLATPSPRRLLCSHGGRGCSEGLSEKREQEAWSAGWSWTGSWAWRCVPVALCPCVPWRPCHPRKAACLSLPPCKVGVLGRYLGVLWRLMASRGSNHPQPLPSHLLNPLALPFKFSELCLLVFQPVFPPDSKRLVTK